jgi:hypothetical protein
MKMLLEMGNQNGIYPSNNNIISIDNEKNNTRRCFVKNQERVILVLLERKLKQGGLILVKLSSMSLF